MLFELLYNTMAFVDVFQISKRNAYCELKISPNGRVYEFFRKQASKCLVADAMDSHFRVQASARALLLLMLRRVSVAVVERRTLTEIGVICTYIHHAEELCMRRRHR